MRKPLLNKQIEKTVFRTMLACAIISAAPVAKVSAYDRYTTTGVNIRSGPGITYSKTGSISKGTAVDVISDSNGWTLLGDETYICSAYLADDAKSTGQQLYSLKGKSYQKANVGGSNIRYLDYATADKYMQNGYIVDYMISGRGTHYYAVEAGTDTGKDVQKLSKGSVITIDETTFVIDGEIVADYNTDDAIQIWESIDFAPCIQTCIPPYGGPVVIKYGHTV